MGGGNARQPVVYCGDGDNDSALDTERIKVEKLDDGSLSITGLALNGTTPVGTDVLLVPAANAPRFRLRLDQVIAHAKLTPEDGISVSWKNATGEPEVNAVEWLEESAKVQITQASTANSLAMLLGTAEGLVKGLNTLGISPETFPAT